MISTTSFNARFRQQYSRGKLSVWDTTSQTHELQGKMKSFRERRAWRQERPHFSLFADHHAPLSLKQAMDNPLDGATDACTALDGKIITTTKSSNLTYTDRRCSHRPSEHPFVRTASPATRLRPNRNQVTHGDELSNHPPHPAKARPLLSFPFCPNP